MKMVGKTLYNRQKKGLNAGHSLGFTNGLGGRR